MNRKNIILIVFIIVGLLQLAAPISMILKREAALEKGRQYKFRTAPVDPYDAFRGRYVALDTEEDSVIVEKGSEWGRGERVYVIIEEDEDGFARLTAVQREKPESDNYIKVEAAWNYGGTNLYLNMPFDRYYMNEKDAPEAESAYRKHSNRKERDAYITVRVLNGFAILEELYIADTPIADFLKKDSAP